MRHRLMGLTLAALLGATPAYAAEPAPVAPPKPAVKSVKVRKGDNIRTAALGPLPDAIPFRADANLANWYRERGDVRFPDTDRLAYCHGYNCLYRQTVPMDDDDLKELAVIFAAHDRTAEEEREGINLAVSWWEKRAAALIGAPPDVRGSDFAHSGKPGQTDCLDEATNSTTILIYLQRHGLLRYHQVLRPDSRGGLLITLVHATAVFEDRDGKDWVVDSWMRDSGDPNDIMPLADWRSKLL